ncbi:MAG: hypothetical protein ACK50A_10855 [Sphingobacteriaceae bacterium]|jgi:hypothetical protein
MKTKSKTLILILIISSAFYTCKKKKVPEPDPVPTLELISITPSTVKEFQDSILIRLKYKDANGDLGDLSPDEHSLYIKDSRLPNPDTYHVKPLAPVSSENIPIEGELTVKLNSLFLLGNGNSETTTFSIKMKDRAGHWTTEFNSPTITINK